MKILAITSMYANPIHPGHIECLDLSKELADELWVIINNDNQAKLKRGVDSFQDEKSREKIIGSLKSVDKTFISIDKDKTVCKTLEKLIIKAKNTGTYDKIIFTKGGDRFAGEIPEAKICKKYGIDIIDGLGIKIQSSSDLINKISNPKDLKDLQKELNNIPKEDIEDRYLEIGKRPWGIYYVLEESNGYKIKKLIVNPHSKLSLQSHTKRNEHWVVVKGTAQIDLRNPKYQDIKQIKVLEKNESCIIPKGYIHRIINNTDELLVIVEVQVGEYLGEDDIKRYEDDWNRK